MSPGYPVVPVVGRAGWHTAGPLLVYATRDGEEARWHLSVSRRDRIPTWPEIMHIKRALIPPDVFMVVCVPPDHYWMNGHPNVIQLNEVRDQELIAYMIETYQEAVESGMNTIPCDGRRL